MDFFLGHRTERFLVGSWRPRIVGTILPRL
uniref:Uncharacterized protein n=1 Tax=Rhizophora mucronata TaxID=61149 RepID=A0A2P2P482_RHIMU